jgi:hypothetical protein
MASMTISTGISEYTISGADGRTLQYMLVTLAIARGIQPREITAVWTRDCDADLLSIQLSLAERYGKYETLLLYVPNIVRQVVNDDGRTGLALVV